MTIPNQLTVLRILLTPVFLYLFFQDEFLFKCIALVVFIFASLTDWYDGHFARKHGVVTSWGTFMDPLADKILVSSAFISFYILGYVHLWMILIIILRDFLITGLRSYAIYKQHPVATMQLARVKTFVQITSIYVIFLFVLYDTWTESSGIKFKIVTWLKDIDFINYFMLAVVILTAYTGVLYFIKNREQLISFLKK